MKHQHDLASTLECERCNTTVCVRCIIQEFDELIAYATDESLCAFPSDTCPLTVVYETRRQQALKGATKHVI